MNKTKFSLVVFFLLTFIACSGKVEKKDFFFVKSEKIIPIENLQNMQPSQSLQASTSLQVPTDSKASTSLQNSYDLQSSELFVAGTCSHHLLVEQEINSWFATLKENRKINEKPIKTFFIISPSHYGKSFQPFSLTDKKWRFSFGGFISNDFEISKKIAIALKVKFDNEAFAGEHGVNCLLPYVKTYFPEAKVVPILVPESKNDTALASSLSSVLESYFIDSNDEIIPENFLLISTDFSHHQGLSETIRRDKLSKKFFDSPLAKNFIYAICDNRIGIYVLSHVLNSDANKLKTCFLSNLNSYQKSGVDTDITSYNFSLFSVEK